MTQIEIELIRALRSNDSAIGYNKWSKPTNARAWYFPGASPSGVDASMSNRLRRPIQIGFQSQVKKPVILHSTGTFSCGRYRYRGRRKEEFAEYYRHIEHFIARRIPGNVPDVSFVKHRTVTDVLTILEDRFDDAILIEEIRKIVYESEVATHHGDSSRVLSCFAGAMARMVKSYGPDDPLRPREGWQTL